MRFAVLDRDQSRASRELVEQFSGSRYFVQTDDVRSEADADRRLRAATDMLVVDIPPGFERDLLAGRQPQLAFRVDGVQPVPRRDHARLCHRRAAGLRQYADARAAGPPRRAAGVDRVALYL
ncbi:hypothetical protein ACU4GD_16640 [Cupriavidus basilensis]